MAIDGGEEPKVGFSLTGGKRREVEGSKETGLTLEFDNGDERAALCFREKSSGIGFDETK